MNFSFGQPIRRDLDLKHVFETEKWMTTEYGDRFEEYHKVRWWSYGKT